MSEVSPPGTAQRMLFCVGATKAGTSWLYRALHDHPECALKSVKEMHYWDTSAPEVQRKQVAALQGRFNDFTAQLEEAKAAGRGWQVTNMQRRLKDLSDLIAVLLSPRDGHRDYVDWMGEGAEGRLCADLTPNYGLLDEAILREMVQAFPDAKWVYLIRDPLERLWSHVRMQAKRQKQPHETHEGKSNGILKRILNHGHETHILERGDYIGAVRRLRSVVPAAQLSVEFCERLFTPEGWGSMCLYLGLSETQVDGADRAHAGPQAQMKEQLKPQAIRFLRQQYDWAAREIGPLPDNWQRNLARANA